MSLTILMDRTKDTIAAMVSVWGTNDSTKQNQGSIEECINKRLNDYDPILHDVIRRKMEEKQWIVLED